MSSFYGWRKSLEDKKYWLCKVADEKVERVRSLKGKYVVISVANNGGITYQVDRHINRKIWWTYLLENAYGYYSYNSAREAIQKLNCKNLKIKRVSKAMIDEATAKIDDWYFSELDILLEG